jgi:hypothetical protein
MPLEPESGRARHRRSRPTGYRLARDAPRRLRRVAADPRCENHTARGQTGVSYPAMLHHYGTCLRSEGPDQFAKLSAQAVQASPIPDQQS